MNNEQPVRVLIVDDTSMYRLILDRAASEISGVQVTGKAGTGEQALQKLSSTQVDLVLLDVFMPGMSGVETLQKIKAQHPDIAVVMVSGVATNDAEITIQALNFGALDFIPKPKEKSPEESMRSLIEELKRVVDEVRAHRAKAVKKEPPAPSKKITTLTPSKVDLVVVGVSTGGPNALGIMVPALPKDIPCPILLVQHMPPIFTASLADHLAKKSSIYVKEAIANENIVPGTVFIAPGGKHLVIKKNPSNPSHYVTALNDDPPVNSCRPAVDVLFKSVADTFQGSVLAVILTGMGEDGANGVAALKNKKCYCISQSEKSCVVYGMPRAIEERHLADEVVPLQEVAGRIEALAKGA